MLSVDLDPLTSIHIKPEVSNQYTTQTHQQSSACAEEKKTSLYQKQWINQNKTLINERFSTFDVQK